MAAANTNKCFQALSAMKYCQGTPVTPGIRKRLFVVAVSAIVGWPKIKTDDYGRPTSSVYDGQFTLAEGVKWTQIDHLAPKAEFKSEAQGEEPSRTFKQTVNVVYPPIDEVAATAATTLLNTRVVALVEDMRGKFRVVGCEQYDGALVTPSRDHGQGATGTAGTSLSFEADDPVEAPFYEGPIETEDGTINEKN